MREGEEEDELIDVSTQQVGGVDQLPGDFGHAQSLLHGLTAQQLFSAAQAGNLASTIWEAIKASMANFGIFLLNMAREYGPKIAEAIAGGNTGAMASLLGVKARQAKQALSKGEFSKDNYTEIGESARGEIQAEIEKQVHHGVTADEVIAAMKKPSKERTPDEDQMLKSVRDWAGKEYAPTPYHDVRALTNEGIAAAQQKKLDEMWGATFNPKAQGADYITQLQAQVAGKAAAVADSADTEAAYAEMEKLAAETKEVAANMGELGKQILAALQGVAYFQ